MNKIDARSLTAITAGATKLEDLLADYEVEREIASAKFAQLIETINEARDELREMLDDEASDFPEIDPPAYLATIADGEFAEFVFEG